MRRQKRCKPAGFLRIACGCLREMLYIPNVNHDPAMNLAMEEYILSSSGIRDQVLFFYVNAPSVIIGRHQNTSDEINAEFVRKQGIQLVRRCSGGGAVYHDTGNLNYSLIFPGDPKLNGDFSVLLVPILDALHSLGLPAELGGRNDLLLNGLKFSGNAYYHNQFGSVTHGTLLFNSDLDVLSKALQPSYQKLKAKGIASVRSRVCCIKDSLPNLADTEELKEAILDYFREEYSITTRNFSESEFQQIELLADKRYRNDVWTYGESPAYTIRRFFHPSCGLIDFRADVRENIIQNIRFFGDFFCPEEISSLEEALKGTPWQESDIRDLLLRAHWESFFPDFSVEMFISGLFSVKEDV